MSKKANKINFFPEAEANISNNVRYLRKKNGWTQEELGEKVGVTKQQIGYVERGSFPSPQVLFNLVHVFNIKKENLHDFFFDDIVKVDQYFIIDRNLASKVEEPSEPISSQTFTLEDLPMIIGRMRDEIQSLRSDVDALKESNNS